MSLMYLLPAVVAFAVSLVCIFLLLTPPMRRWILDRPNERSLHALPTPRSGGIAIAGGVAAGLAFASEWPLSASLLAVALAAISLVDDLLSLPTLVRLVAHLLAAATFVVLELKGDVALLILLALAIAWYANLFNFMDGADGLAGGMAVFGFGAYSLAAGQSGNAVLAASGAVIAAAAFAFLLFNFHPARLFMGDSGSIPLGFLAGALGIVGWRDGAWPLWFPVLVFAPFVVDASLTLAKRAAGRKPILSAHREHYYQRMVRMGFGHRRTSCVEYGVMAGCATVALLAREAASGVQVLAVAFVAVAFLLAAAWIDRRWFRLSSEGGE